MGEQSQLRGAKLTVAALPGLTAEWLDRELECHSAHITLGRTASTPEDPFWLPDSTVDIDVRPTKKTALPSGSRGFRRPTLAKFSPARRRSPRRSGRPPPRRGLGTSGGMGPTRTAERRANAGSP